MTRLEAVFLHEHMSKVQHAMENARQQLLALREVNKDLTTQIVENTGVLNVLQEVIDNAHS